MGFYRQFDNFDPLTGEVSVHSFPSIREIAEKARKLLATRSREEIEYAAYFIDWATEDFINDEITYGLEDLRKRRIEREETIRDLEQQCEDDEFIFHGDFPEVMSDDDFRSSFEDRLVWALKECYSWHSPSDEDEIEFKDGKDYEYFAVLALWLVADSVEANKYSGEKVLQQMKEMFPEFEMSPEMIQAKKKGYPISDELRSQALALRIGPLPEYVATPDEIRLSGSGRYAIAAMEAVCFAEHLYEVGQIKDRHQKKMEEEIGQIEKNHITKFGEELKRSATDKARKAANMRHAKTTHLIKKFAIDQYLKERDAFVSIKEAARIILDDVVNYARELKANTLSGVSAFDQVYMWLRQAENNHKMQ